MWPVFLFQESQCGGELGQLMLGEEERLLVTQNQLCTECVLSPLSTHSSPH